MKESIKIVVACTLSRRNPVAASLHLAQFRKQTVRNVKTYTRKGRQARKDQHE